ncbi:MAG: glucose 1-dehydrogenase [Bacteroidota bacterium]
MSSLSGKKALITGASRGIGAGVAVGLAQKGADVVIHYYQDQDLIQAQQVEQEINALGRQSILVQADVSKLPDIERMFDQVEATWGSLDILVNNAGILISKPLLDLTKDDYQDLMHTNLRGAFFCAQRVLAGMVAQAWGRIINISSVHEKMPTGFSAIYSMSKGGMMMMCKELARDFSRHGITVNNIAPGAIRTDINRAFLSDPANEAELIERIPARFIAEPKDIGATAAFLASEDARYITGTTLYVDGGLAM